MHQFDKTKVILLFLGIQQLHSQEKKSSSYLLAPLEFVCHPTVPSVSPLTLQIILPPHLDNVRDKLAENIHELWGMNKIELGWTYGKVTLLSSITFNTQKHAGCDK